ncbi:hypothetical protein K2173_013479 [Erythroxylum novogranatense]|uniref:C2 domain-containing protein n=1 Tax=Erythroxylum novogranatense TaxID=1862640 RepID=A0AAV8SA45_9ROSI|nr:hypothetical protein K2173_013479 [Erythroxylum novogranatense]
MSNVKVGVEVVSAHDLMAKDGQGSSSAFVELHFDHQKFRTTTKEKDLNPVWNERFHFNLSDPKTLPNLTLNAYVYNHNKQNNSRSFLGKVRLTGKSFVPCSDAIVLYYPLEKRGIFSRIKGELGLKVFVTDDPSIVEMSCLGQPEVLSNPLPEMGSSLFSDSRSTKSQATELQIPDSSVSNPFTSDRDESRRIFQQPSRSSKSYSMNFGSNEMRAEPPGSRIVRMYSGPSSQQADYALKETNPLLGAGQVVGGRIVRGNRPTNSYDLVEQMSYLFVRVVRARHLPIKDVTGSLDPYVEVKVGNYKETTKHFEKNSNPEWNEVFAFARDRVQSSLLEVVIMDKDMVKDDFVGILRFDMNEIPTRVPPDSPLAPEWYLLESKKGEKKKGELMIAVWYGTQADEAFPNSWISDTITRDSSTVSSHFRSKVYHSPRLWYVRVNVIEAQDLVLSDKNRFLDAHVKVQIGNQVLKTRMVRSRTMNAFWNEELMLVAAEPFEEYLIFSVEDRIGHNNDVSIGKVVVPLNTVPRHADDDRKVPTRWFNLEKSISAAIDKHDKKDKFSSRLHLGVILDGGYHVLDAPTHYSSDLQPAAKQLWKPSVGILELGILNADGLHPFKSRDGKGTSDTYCVAKYGQKWVRTRTITNSLNPKYNEQYTWDVHDPATVLTVGVFDNSQIDVPNGNIRDSKVGKVRIRLSTLETGRVYTHSYPLLDLHPSGLKKMGELHLAIRFSYNSFADMVYLYSKPLLPKMHYVRPLSVMQQDQLRNQAVNMVAAKLGRAEPPLRKEVVEFMTDAHSHLWSMRRSKGNFFRLMTLFSGFFAVGRWFGEVCMWKNPVTTLLVHLLFVMLVCYPELILPTAFLYMFLIGLWNYRFRPRYPPHMNTTMSYADAVHPDELDEEFDTFPTTRRSEIVRMRYDRLRSVAGRIQTVVGDVATQGERVQALLNWLAALVLYATPFQVLVLMVAFYFMRHPRFRHRTPPAPINFFRRLPARNDSML